MKERWRIIDSLDFGNVKRCIVKAVLKEKNNDQRLSNNYFYNT